MKFQGTSIIESLHIPVTGLLFSSPVPIIGNCPTLIITLQRDVYSTDHIGELPLLLHPDSHHPGGPQNVRNPLHVTHCRVAQMS